MIISYGDSAYHHDTLRQIATDFLAVLPKNTSALLTIGSSGNSIASAMLVLSKQPLHHRAIRKEGESTHTAVFAGTDRYDFNYAIIDDFIATGQTIDKLFDHAIKHGLKIEAIIVGDDREKSQWLRQYGCPIVEVYPDD